MYEYEPEPYDCRWSVEYESADPTMNREYLLGALVERLNLLWSYDDGSLQAAFQSAFELAEDDLGFQMEQVMLAMIDADYHGIEKVQ